MTTIPTELDTLRARVKELEQLRSERDRLRTELEKTQASCAAMRKALEESGWHKCGCPGHWKEHSVTCPIGSVLSFNPAVQPQKEVRDLMDERNAGLTAALRKCVECLDNLVCNTNAKRREALTLAAPLLTEPRKERCWRCGNMVSDWVDPDWAKGRICRECENSAEATKKGKE